MASAKFTLGVLALAAAGNSWAQGDAVPGTPVNGQLRTQWEQRQDNRNGPLAQANALHPGAAAAPASGATLAAELRANGNGWVASATFQAQTQAGGPAQSRAWFNELAASAEVGGWQLSAGKKIVAWDVGYAFRPNDVVQSEARRTLVETLPEGRPVLMAEHFAADTAWSLVMVNPTKARAQTGATEPALAARVYRRAGAVDWHGFARLGARTGGSLGGAAAWVASEAVELHTSVRYLADFDTLASHAASTAVLASNPWRAASGRSATQALLGGTWTNESQLSVLAEAWWDGTALSNAQWEAWGLRNRTLRGLAAFGVPAGALAGNLAWQADAFGAASSLRRSNVYVRVSWSHEAWQPALDVLVNPADRGRVTTASLLWKGDRMQMQGGLRVVGGPATAVLAQLPTRRQAFLSAIWTF